MAVTSLHAAPAHEKSPHGDFAAALQSLEELRDSIYRAESLTLMASQSANLEPFTANALHGLHDLLSSIRIAASHDIEWLATGASDRRAVQCLPGRDCCQPGGAQFQAVRSD